MDVKTSLAPAERLQSANQWVFDNVEGWVGDRIVQILEFVRRHHEEHGVAGDICEIGVHHGKLFFLLSQIARENEKCIAVDLFEHQELNLDRSGKGSLSKFQEHMETGFPGLSKRVKIVSKDSMSITPATILKDLGSTNIRIFSVDGGHTVDHAVNDLCIAQDVLAPGGVVLLDDFFGVAWTGVTEGYFKYMNYFNKRLLPFLIFQNKLFLTTFSEKENMLSQFRTYIDSVVGNEIHTKWKYVQLSDEKVLSYFGR